MAENTLASNFINQQETAIIEKSEDSK